MGRICPRLTKDRLAFALGVAPAAIFALAGLGRDRAREHALAGFCEFTSQPLMGTSSAIEHHKTRLLRKRMRRGPTSSPRHEIAGWLRVRGIAWIGARVHAPRLKGGADAGQSWGTGRRSTVHFLHSAGVQAAGALEPVFGDGRVGATRQVRVAALQRCMAFRCGGCKARAGVDIRSRV